MRSGQIRTREEFSRAIIVKPPLAWLETRDNRMAGSCVVFRCVLTWRSIATADMTTFGASAKMQPPTSGRQAFNTTSATRLGEGMYARSLRFHESPHPRLRSTYAAYMLILSLLDGHPIGARASPRTWNNVSPGRLATGSSTPGARGQNQAPTYRRLSVPTAQAPRRSGLTYSPSAKELNR